MTGKPGTQRPVFDEQVPMPELSRFLGIVVQMYFEDHQPPHSARYGEYRIKVLIESGVVEGGFLRVPCGTSWSSTICTERS